MKKSVGQNLGNDFKQEIQKADGSKVIKSGWVGNLGIRERRNEVEVLRS